jgi:hypothetical protein
MSARSSGRGRLPVWVVRIRSVLRFIAGDLPDFFADAAIRIEH